MEDASVFIFSVVFMKTLMHEPKWGIRKQKLKWPLIVI